ncbi:unnamed protein product, partial [Rotaria magnacalcarata]
AERRNREVQQQLEQGEEERQSMKEKYTSIKEEVEDKRANRDKLSKQLKKVEAKKLEIIEKHRIAREELEAEQREIQKQTKLFQLVIQNFIPVDERERLLKRVQFDDRQNRWTLKELSKETDQMAARPVFTRHNRRPIAVHSQMNSVPEVAYFKGENIILLQLDFPSRTTRDYEGPMVSPVLQAAIETAMRDEEHIELDANSIPVDKRKKKKKAIPNNGGTYDDYASSTSTILPIGHGDSNTSR